MRVNLVAMTMGVVCAGVACGVARGQPANNTCASAQVVAVSGLNRTVTVNGNNDNATPDLFQTCGLSDSLDVWYTFTAPAAGVWTFDTFNSILFDTTLAVYTSCGGVQLACSDDYDAENGYFWSAVTLPLTANQTVKVRVAGNNNDSDVFQLNVVGSSSPANNLCVTPLAVTAGQPFSGSTLNATTEFTLPPNSCGNFPGSRGGRDVFLSFTPIASGPYRVSLCSSGFDTVLAVLSNCTGSAASVLACNDDAQACSPGTRSEITAVGLTAGVQYYVRVAGFDFEPPDYGTYTLIITPLTLAVCCRGATCSLINVSQCVPVGGTAGVVFGPSTGCNAAGVSTFPCCYANYNKVNGINVLDIFDFLSDWFAGSGLADVGGIGNGTPNVQDVFMFLSVWFAGGCG